jgi:hypothetical protein
LIVLAGLSFKSAGLSVKSKGLMTKLTGISVKTAGLLSRSFEIIPILNPSAVYWDEYLFLAHLNWYKMLIGKIICDFAKNNVNFSKKIHYSARLQHESARLSTTTARIRKTYRPNLLDIP